MTGNIRVGFTGTRMGMTTDQLSELRRRLSRGEGGTDWRMFSEFHHGDCVGADEQAHDMMRVLLARNWPLRVDIVVHPPKYHRWRAFCYVETDGDEVIGIQDNVKVLEEKEYLERDRDIVDGVDVMIACPGGFDYRGNGGTNYTIRYCLTKKKPLVVIWPDGSVSDGKELNWKEVKEKNA